MRSVLFHLASAVVICVFLPGMVLILAPRSWFWRGYRRFVRVQLWLLRVICGQTFGVSGRHHMPAAPVILACRHESAWETLVLPVLFDNPVVLLKQEILRYPLAGAVARKLGYVGLDRSGDPGAFRRAIADTRRQALGGRHVLVFPGGTRDPRRRERVRSGTAALYRALAMDCVPVIHNSGDLWPYKSGLRRPGRIGVTILAPIRAGQRTRDFIPALESVLARAASAGQIPGHG